MLAQASAFWFCALKPSVARCKLTSTARKKLNRQHSKLECGPQNSNSDRPKQAALDHVRSYYNARRCVAAKPLKCEGVATKLKLQGLRYKRRKRSTSLKRLRFCTLFLEVSLAELSATFWVTNYHKHRLTAKTGSASRVGNTYGQKGGIRFLPSFPSFSFHAFVRKYPFGNAWKVEPLSKVISLKNLK